MSIMADDLLSSTSMLRMAYNFLTGNAYLRRKKFKEKKKLISIVFPLSDLVFACGAIPVFPIRMEKFEVKNFLKALGSITNLFGWKNTTKFLGFLKKLDIKNINTTIDQAIDDILDTVNEKYNQMYDLGVESGISTDFCYGIKSLFGMHVSKGKNVDANFNFTIRCSAWNKYIESLKTIDNNAKQIWIDVPPRNIGNALEILTNNLSNALRDLEDITGESCSDNDLRNQFNIRNQICKHYKTITYEISSSDFYPCNSSTFAELLALLSMSFQDCNSNAKRYLDNISSLVDEMRNRIRKGIGTDVTGMERILITPMFGGWEPKTSFIMEELGGRAIYNDWEILGYLEEISFSNNSNPIEDYARFIFNAYNNYVGCDNETLTDSYLRIAKKLNVDGVIFNQLFGCHSISNCYKLLRDKLRKEEIPSTALTFNKIGENVEQVKTRLGAFMEMFR